MITEESTDATMHRRHELEGDFFAEKAFENGK